MAAAASQGSTWKPHDKLTIAPTNLKEAIDWVLRVTGKDGKKNVAASPPQPPASPPQFACLCFLAKAIKDLLYDARCPGSPGPSPRRYWDDILLEQEECIVKPVLEDLGLLNGGSTSAASSTCAGGTEVIGTLIDHLAQGLQKWVGWKEGDKWCLKGTEGIGKKCDCSGGGAANCCNSGGASCSCNTAGKNCCYLSAYCKKSTASGSSSTPPEGQYYWPTISGDSTKVHLLARIFLGSVCLIWSGLSQLGFLTKEGSGDQRWSKSSLHEIETGDSKGLGSFMAAMGYDLDRLNQGQGKAGTFVNGLLTSTVGWKDLSKGADNNSVAEYYSSIYSGAKTALTGQKTEEICTKYPLLVLHILASGYFRAGSAGAKNITSAPKAPSSDPTKPRHPRTIREILYWLSALPYSEKYKALVERMQGKFPEDDKKNGQLQLHGESQSNTTLLQKDITHYLMAACGYCPLVLIGIQGTIEKEVDKTPGGGGVARADDKRCPEHKKDPSAKRCTLEDANKAKAAAKASAAGSDGKLQAGQVCYGGYHLEVKDFGPLHGMYANGLFGFQMDISPAQCLDQLRIYVYHCFYQLYFLRKQCKEGVESGAVLGWNSCRYGSGVYWGSGYSQSNLWRCKTEGGAGQNGKEHTQKCGISKGAGGNVGDKLSPLMSFLCDALGSMACGKTVGSGVDRYPPIEDHMNTKDDFPPGHLDDRCKNCPVPMGWKSPSSSTTSGENHFKDLNTGTHKKADLAQPGTDKYPAHCTGNTLSHLLEYYCDPVKEHGTLVVLLRLLACITPTVPRTLGDLFGFYYYIVYIGARQSWNFAAKSVWSQLKRELQAVSLHMGSSRGDTLVGALDKFSGITSESDGHHNNDGALMRLYSTTSGQYLCPLSGQQYGQLSPAMAGTYLSWLVYLIGEFKTGLEGLETAFRNIACRDGCGTGAGASGCGDGSKCGKGSHGTMCSTGVGSNGVCGCTSVVSCTGVLPVLYKYGFGYGDVSKLHSTQGQTENKKCHHFLGTLESVKDSVEFKKLTTSINQLIYTTRLPWIFVLTLAWLVAVLYLAFGAIWPLDWTHMRSHCRGWFRKGSLSPWEVLMVGKKKGRGILEFFGKEGKVVVESTTSGYRWVKWLMVIIGTVAVFAGPLVAALVESNGEGSGGS